MLLRKHGQRSTPDKRAGILLQHEETHFDAEDGLRTFTFVTSVPNVNGSSGPSVSDELFGISGQHFHHEDLVHFGEDPDERMMVFLNEAANTQNWRESLDWIVGKRREKPGKEEGKDPSMPTLSALKVANKPSRSGSSSGSNERRSRRTLDDQQAHIFPNPSVSFASRPSSGRSSSPSIPSDLNAVKERLGSVLSRRLDISYGVGIFSMLAVALVAAMAVVMMKRKRQSSSSESKSYRSVEYSPLLQWEPESDESLRPSIKGSISLPIKANKPVTHSSKPAASESFV